MEFIYNGKNNVIIYGLYEDDTQITDYSGITKVTVILGAYNFNSIDSPTFFNVSDEGITLALGAAGIAAGAYRMRLETVDFSNPDGLVWSDALDVHVKDEPA